VKVVALDVQKVRLQSQKLLYDDTKKGIQRSFAAFIVVRDDALIRPRNPWLYEPSIGKAVRDLAPAMRSNAAPTDIVRQIAILGVGIDDNDFNEMDQR
jgi:hypothetical protein